VVEAAHSWMNRFRKPLAWFEKLASSYLGLLIFARAFIRSKPPGFSLRRGLGFPWWLSLWLDAASGALLWV